MNMAFDADKYISKKVADNMSLIKHKACNLTDKVLQGLLCEIMGDPTLYVLQGINNKTAHMLADRGFIKDEKKFEDYIARAKSSKANSFIISPGSNRNGHHSYPGGLVFHTAVNLEIAISMANIYQNVYGLKTDRDLLIMAMILHDIGKATLFDWDQNGDYRDEILIAGTEAHHILSMSEAIRRGFPFSVIKAMAFCHIKLATIREDLLRYLDAAAIIFNRDSVNEYDLDYSGFTCEEFICYFADSEVSLAEWAMGAVNNKMNSKNMNLFQKYQQLSSRSEFAIFKNEIK